MEAAPTNSPVQGSEWRPDRASLLVLLAILAATVLAYAPTVSNGFTNWDDPRYVTENPLVRDLTPAGIGRLLTTPVMGNVHPVTMLSLAMDWSLSGGSAATFHVTSLVLHLLNTILVFLFVQGLGRGRRFPALFTAALFALHPLHVESVAWVSSRKDVLYTFFFFLSLLAYLRFLEAGGRRRYVTSLVFFVLSLFSKPSAVPLPLVLLLLDFWKGRRLDRRCFVEKAPFLTVAIGFGILTYVVQSRMGAFPEVTYTLVERALLGSYGFLAYIVKLVLPIRLSAFYPRPGVDGGLPLVFWLAPVVAAGVVAGTVLSLRRTRFLFFGMAFYFLTIALVLQFFSIGHVLIAERYTYVPYVGLLLLVAWPLAPLVEGETRVRAARAVLGCAVVATVACGVLTRERVRVWRDSETLWTDVVRKHPREYNAYMNRGSYYQRNGERGKALADYRKVVEVRPDRFNGYYNIGVLYQEDRDWPRALESFDEALARKPDHFGTRLNRGAVLLEMGRTDEAIVDLDQAEELDPTSPVVHLNLGNAFLDGNEPDRAIESFGRALELSPEYFLAFLNRGVAHYQKGDYGLAVSDYDRALSLNPRHGSGFLKRSIAHGMLGHREEALRDAIQARSLGVAVDEAYLDQLRGR